jgi:hypothetical protein
MSLLQTKLGQGFLDLKISTTSPKLSQKLSGQFRLCTVTKAKDGSRYISLRLPEDIQETIISAYQDGKTVRIFS